MTKLVSPSAAHCLQFKGSLLVYQEFSFRFLFIHDQHSSSFFLILQNKHVSVNMHECSLLALAAAAVKCDNTDATSASESGQ